MYDEQIESLYQPIKKKKILNKLVDKYKNNIN
jgi:hypothetical protein